MVAFSCAAIKKNVNKSVRRVQGAGGGQLEGIVIRIMEKRFGMKKQLLIPLLIIGVVVASVVSYCSKGSSYGSSGSSSSTNTGTDSNTVTMQSMSFSKASLTIKKGTTVTWVNNDNITHTVTADDNSFNSGDITAGKSFARTFNTTGTFPYHCIYHSMMKATIIVN